MIALTPEASAQLDEFERYYVEQQRPQALRNLGHSLAEASLIILNAPQRGLPAPRPYPELANLELLWLKRGRYWCQSALNSFQGTASNSFQFAGVVSSFLFQVFEALVSRVRIRVVV